MRSDIFEVGLAVVAVGSFASAVVIFVGSLATAQGAAKDSKGAVSSEQQVVLHEIDHIQGIDLQSEGGKDLGDVKDVVLDSTDGSIEYAIIGTGGVLGVAESKRLVPWSALKINPKDPDDPHKLVARTSLTEAQIEAAPQFEKDKHINADFERRIHDAAGVREGEMRDVKALLVCASDIESAKVRGASDDDLGEIEKVLVDPKANYVGYVVFASGGTLGLGEKHFALPWQVLDLSADGEGKIAVRAPTLTKERLANAPEFDAKDKERMFRRDWVSQVARHYEVEPYWSQTRPASAPLKRD